MKRYVKRGLGAVIVAAATIGLLALSLLGKHSSHGPRKSPHIAAITEQDTQKVVETREAFSAPPDVPEAPPPAVRLRNFARQSKLRVVDSDSLALNDAVGELLELTLTETEAVNESLKTFMKRLREAELAQAYASVAPNGDEEIVVPAFDRSKLVTDLREEISKKVTPEVGAFVAGQLPFDSTLAVLNSDIRLSIETGDDGLDRVSITTQVQRPEAVDAVTPIVQKGIRFAPTLTIKSAGLLSDKLPPRYQHLFAAEKSLPRRARPAE